MTETLLYCEINLFCMVLLGIMMYRSAKYGLGSDTKKLSFLMTIWCVAAVNLSDIIWKLGIAKPTIIPHFVMYVANAWYFMSLCAAVICWFVFSIRAQNRPAPSRNVMRFGFFLPLLIFFILMLITPFTGWFFTFNENGEYVRGPLFYLQFVPTFIYTVILSVNNLVYAYSIKSYERSETYLSLCAFGFPLIVCTVLQALFQKLPILSIAPTISLILTYTNSLKIQIASDPLTGIYNRRMLVDELSHRMKSVKSNKKLYFVFMDIDDFKILNDKHGHREGDNALILVADCLNAICSESNGFCARYGGDEFAVVQELDLNESIAEFCENIERTIAERSLQSDGKFTVSVSVGHAEYLKDGNSVQSLINIADRHMYTRKSAKSATIE